LASSTREPIYKRERERERFTQVSSTDGQPLEDGESALVVAVAVIIIGGECRVPVELIDLLGNVARGLWRVDASGVLLQLLVEFEEGILDGLVWYTLLIVLVVGR